MLFLTFPLLLLVEDKRTETRWFKEQSKEACRLNTPTATRKYSTVLRVTLNKTTRTIRKMVAMRIIDT